MSSYFPNGTIFSIGTAYSAPKAITAITNANPGVVTSNSHGFSDGDIIEVTSGWPGLNQRVVRVAGSSSNSYELEDIDTSNTSKFSPGAGIGSAREVTTWVALNQVTNVQSQGGEQQFAQWVYLEDGVQRQRPTFKNAKSLQLTLDYDPDLPWYQALLDADESNVPHVIRAALPSGDFIYYNMYVGFDGEPSVNVNQNMAVVANFSHAARFIRYAAPVST